MRAMVLTQREMLVQYTLTPSQDIMSSLETEKTRKDGGSIFGDAHLQASKQFGESGTNSTVGKAPIALKTRARTIHSIILYLEFTACFLMLQFCFGFYIAEHYLDSELPKLEGWKDHPVWKLIDVVLPFYCARGIDLTINFIFSIYESMLFMDLEQLAIHPLFSSQYATFLERRFYGTVAGRVLAMVVFIAAFWGKGKYSQDW
jgi:hypothetical protein